MMREHFVANEADFLKSCDLIAKSSVFGFDTEFVSEESFRPELCLVQVATPEDLFVLLRNIRHVHAGGDVLKYLVPDDALVAVLKRANETLGAEYFKTPRDIVRSFVSLLNIIEQNPGVTWQKLVDTNFIKKPTAPLSVEEEVARGVPPPADSDSDSDLQNFKL